MKYSYFFNPFEWVRAFRFARKQSKFDKSAYDLELWLYSQILTNKMLHFGYFEDIHIKSEDISLKQLEDAQIKYAENIIGHIYNKEHPILDVGCGMGGLSELIHQKKLQVEPLSPNKNQIDFINENLPFLTTHKCKFQDFQANKKYGTIINSESIQYIPLKDVFAKINEHIVPGGRWIVVDYFRQNNDGINKSSHLLSDFREKLQEHKWNILHERDITLNVLPTLTFVNMYVERFLLPVKHFAFEKLRYKNPKLYYMTKRLRASVDKKIGKEKASIDPVTFKEEKKYMFFVMEKASSHNS